jgi:hypothetical protein
MKTITIKILTLRKGEEILADLWQYIDSHVTEFSIIDAPDADRQRYGAKTKHDEPTLTVSHHGSGESVLLPNNFQDLCWSHPVNGALALWRRSMHLKTSIAILKWERMIQYQLLQPGGMAVDTPHVPHNTPEGEVGKPEGLSGSQIAANSLVCILTLPLLRSIKKCKLCNDSSQ